VLLTVVCIWVVVWENIVRARYGQFVYKDQVLLFSTFSFWFALENYCRVVVIGFCFHCLTPLELELIELVEVYQTMLTWYSAELFPLFIVLVLLFTVVVVVNFFFN